MTRGESNRETRHLTGQETCPSLHLAPSKSDKEQCILFEEDEKNPFQSIIGPEPSIPLSEIYGRIETL
ncbi:MAG: hypothetical protein HUU08_15425 [Candidatus Brocadia sp.]|nr:hypothetical protein [Candidatus Brocadia sp.]